MRVICVGGSQGHGGQLGTAEGGRGRDAGERGHTRLEQEELGVRAEEGGWGFGGWISRLGCKEKRFGFGGGVVNGCKAGKTGRRMTGKREKDSKESTTWGEKAATHFEREGPEEAVLIAQ